MQYHSYDVRTGEYVGSFDADPNPEELGEFLVPSFSSLDVPPQPGEKQAAVFKDGAWLLVADRRGETWYDADRKPVEIDELGDPSEQGLLELQPPPPLPTKDELIAYTAIRRLEREIGGMVSPNFGPLLTDRDTRAILGQAVQSIDLGIVQPPINFKTPSGFRSLDRAAFIAISTEIVAHVQASFDMEQIVLEQIESEVITTKEMIDAAFAA